ncbi:hypothetical protein Pmani_031477 [Petrolisthes manimaculis]|uniref:Methyltransferase FkbM domain-containing protein n=1 Tax=Petrolisthes manimaculis TaxID=1843537 RepID=A0AAE1NTL3_9EUCA|nr:hypothetical protein Pmani_031477 [Petrolisthes manimaculis]
MRTGAGVGVGVGDVERMVSWVVRRYGKFLLAGALSTFLALNLALHAGTGLAMFCEQECIDRLMSTPLHSIDKDAVLYIRKHWIDAPPAPPASFKSTVPLDKPPWYSLGSWGEAYNFVNDYFSKYEKPGTFMELGAGDGEFMSLTLWVERVKGFKGLLVEPNPRVYDRLRALGRASHSVRACATPEQGHRKEVLWLRQIPDNLPPLLTRMQAGSNRLYQYVSKEDRELGETVGIQCFNAGALALAGLNTNRVDLLTISTHGGEMEILASIPRAVQFREERDDLFNVAASRGLYQVFEKGNIHILVPDNEVKVV